MQHKILIHTAASVLVTICVLAVVSCGSPYDGLVSDSKLAAALEAAGENRASLEAVLEKYAAEGTKSQKYIAARYLIENMPGHYGYESELLDSYLDYYRCLKKSVSSGRTPRFVADSVASANGVFHLDESEKCYDIVTVDSAYLCREIDFAFETWEREPWGRNVLFEDFCRYVLPFRVGNEALSAWREKYNARYSCFLDDFRRDTTVSSNPGLAAMEVCRRILPKDSLCYTSITPASMPNVGPEVAECGSGTCREFGDLMTYICRSLCIPVHTDFMPLRGDDNVGHSWISFNDTEGTLYCYEFGRFIDPVEESAPYRKSKLKVYRSLYDSPESVDDVTSYYTDNLLKSLWIPSRKLYRKLSARPWLCQYSNGEWKPVAPGRKVFGAAVFTDLCRGDVFRVAEFDRGKLRLLSYPMYVDDSGELVVLAPDKNVRDVVLYSKFPLDHEHHFFRAVLGGVFEGSNIADFSVSDTLAVIDSLPERRVTVLPSASDKPYKYLRYRGADSTYSHIADVFFYGLDGELLSGTPIGTTGSRNGDSAKTFVAALDGNNRTSFAAAQMSGGWTGWMLDNPERVSAVGFTPPNLDSFIVEGHEFELLYCDKYWKSLGTVTADSDSVVFRNVPDNCLMTLRNLTRGKHEYVFTYHDGKQCWSR